jgi:hypothetical protein
MDLIINAEIDIYKAKNLTGNSVSNAIINTGELKFKNLLRHALVYALNAVNINGFINIIDEPYKTQLIKSYKIDFWQVKQEVFKVLKDNIEIIEVDNIEGVIKLKKVNHPYSYNGLSFGIVFSGDLKEEPVLKKCIASIGACAVDDNYEIIVCGPSAYNPANLLASNGAYKVRYLPKDTSSDKRIMICEKKNFIFANTNFDLVVICHSRINFETGFMAKALSSTIEMATPAVFFKEESRLHKYLDIGFIGKYEDLIFGSFAKPTISGAMISADYLKWYKRMVPYIDGGLNIFNKKVIKEPPYNNHIAWGEAEDIDVCNTLFNKGILIDYLPGINCYSVTNKISLQTNLLKKVYRFYKGMLTNI